MPSLTNSASGNLFRAKKRLTDVVFYDSLGTCAFECPDPGRVIGLAKAV